MVQNEPKRLKLSLWVQPSMPVLKTIACQGADWCAYSRARRQPLTLSNQQRRSLKQSRCLCWHLLQFTWESKATCSQQQWRWRWSTPTPSRQGRILHCSCDSYCTDWAARAALRDCKLPKKKKIFSWKRTIITFKHTLYQLRLALGNWI